MGGRCPARGQWQTGRHGFGKYKEERIQLNEETYWSGGPYNTVVKDGYKVLPEIQQKSFLKENSSKLIIYSAGI